MAWKRGRRSTRRDAAELQAEIQAAIVKWDALTPEEKMRAGSRDMHSTPAGKNFALQYDDKVLGYFATYEEAEQAGFVVCSSRREGFLVVTVGGAPVIDIDGSRKDG